MRARLADRRPPVARTRRDRPAGTVDPAARHGDDRGDPGLLRGRCDVLEPAA